MTSSLSLALDMVLASMLVATGLRVLLARDHFQSIVLFIILGLLHGIVWCKLTAVDVALAEVAIGAGLTGALLLNSLSATSLSVSRRSAQEQYQELQALQHVSVAVRKISSAPFFVKASATVLFVGMIIIGLATVVLPLAQATNEPTIAVDDAMPSSGVSNSVTAVLLNFRAYDTLLEVAVLLAAVWSVLAVLSNSSHRVGESPAGPVLSSFAHLLVPLVILVAVYILWTGTKAPGGAFQAAAVLGATGVLMIVCGSQPAPLALHAWRILLVGGPTVFLLVGLAGIMVGGRFLELPPQWAGWLILLVEMTLTASIALVLLLLFSGNTTSFTEYRISQGSKELAGMVNATDGDSRNTQKEDP